MALSKRVYWIAALVALFALAGAAITVSSRMTFAGGGDGASSAPCQQEAADNDAAENESASQPDDGEECDDGENEAANAGKIDDGADLLPQAGITLDEAIQAAQGAADGSIGEIDLEHYQGKLVFNVDVGDKDVKVDAATGAVLAADQSD